MPPLPLNDAHWGGFFITPVQVFVYPTKKAFHVWRAFLVKPKQLNKLKKHITTEQK